MFNRLSLVAALQHCFDSFKIYNYIQREDFNIYSKEKLSIAPKYFHLWTYLVLNVKSVLKMSVILETTKGDLTVDLYTKERPKSKNNFNYHHFIMALWL